MGIELEWPREADERLCADVHAVLCAVVEAGGAVGHLTPPDRYRHDEWLNGVLKQVRAGDAAFALIPGKAFGLWRRGTIVHRHNAEIQQVMASPAARGLGLGRLVMEALVQNARAAGIEVLTLSTRGNNHGAIELYEAVGFREYGRIPNALAVGDERWDEVRMFLPLGRPSGVTLRGSSPGGHGSSPRRSSGEPC